MTKDVKKILDIFADNLSNIPNESDLCKDDTESEESEENDNDKSSDSGGDSFKKTKNSNLK